MLSEPHTGGKAVPLQITEGARRVFFELTLLCNSVVLLESIIGCAYTVASEYFGPYTTFVELASPVIHPSGARDLRLSYRFDLYYLASNEFNK